RDAEGIHFKKNSLRPRVSASKLDGEGLTRYRTAGTVPGTNPRTLQGDIAMRKPCIWIFVLSLLLAPAAASFAQTFGQITGKVADSTGGVLIGASVSVTNTQTGLTRTEQVNSAGVYVFPNLLPGV